MFPFHSLNERSPFRFACSYRVCHLVMTNHGYVVCGYGEFDDSWISCYTDNGHSKNECECWLYSCFDYSWLAGFAWYHYLFVLYNTKLNRNIRIPSYVPYCVFSEDDYFSIVSISTFSISFGYHFRFSFRHNSHSSDEWLSRDAFSDYHFLDYQIIHPPSSF